MRCGAEPYDDGTEYRERQISLAMAQPSAHHSAMSGRRVAGTGLAVALLLAACTNVSDSARSAPFPKVTDDQQVIAIPEDAVAVSLGPLAETSKTFSDHLSTYVHRGITIEIAVDGDPTIAAMPRKPPLRPPSPEDGPIAEADVGREINLVERVGGHPGTGIRAKLSAKMDESNARTMVDDVAFVSEATAQAIGSVDARRHLAPANGAGPKPFETASIKIGGLTLERQLVPIGSFVSVAGNIDEWTSNTGNSWTVGMHLETEGEVADAAVTDAQSCVLLFAPPWLRIRGDDLVLATAEDPALAGVWNVLCGPDADTSLTISGRNGANETTLLRLIDGANS